MHWGASDAIHKCCVACAPAVCTHKSGIKKNGGILFRTDGGVCWCCLVVWYGGGGIGDAVRHKSAKHKTQNTSHDDWVLLGTIWVLVAVNLDASDASDASMQDDCIGLILHWLEIALTSDASDASLSNCELVRMHWGASDANVKMLRCVCAGCMHKRAVFKKRRHSV